MPYEVTYVDGGCGCLRLNIPDIFVLDSNKTPFEFIRSSGIILNGVFVAFSVVNFATKAEIVSYFNTTFVVENSYNSRAYIEGSKIMLINVDNFTTAELMIEYGIKALNIKIGTPDPLINADYDLEFSNPVFADGFCSISSPEFLNLKEIELRISNITSEPVAGQHKYYAVDPDNSANGRFDFYFPIENSNAYASFSQISE